MNSRNISSRTVSTCSHQTPKFSAVDYTWTQTYIEIKTIGHLFHVGHIKTCEQPQRL